MEAALVLDAVKYANWARLYPRITEDTGVLDLAFDSDRFDVRDDVVGLPTKDRDPERFAAARRRAADLPLNLAAVHGVPVGGLATLAAARTLVEASPLLSLDAKQIAAILRSPEDMRSDVRTDAFLAIVEAAYAPYIADRDETRALLSKRDDLCAKLLDVQHKAQGGPKLYPDCNGSLRVSVGRVEGYAPADAVVHRPSTTLAGLLDKAQDASIRYAPDDPAIADFSPPARFLDVVATAPGARKTPANLLYSTDTLGGNSGSPVLNARGAFVAINFDRQSHGLVNEYKYDPDYSRSIGVDVRMILWLVGTYDGAARLVDEILHRDGRAS